MTTNNAVDNLLDTAVDGLNRRLIANDGTTIKVDFSDPNNTIFNSSRGTEFAIFESGGTVANFIQVRGAPTANSPLFTCEGSDSDVGLTFMSKGIGTIDFTSDAGPILLFIPAASAANYILMGNAATGNTPFIKAVGSDVDVPLTLSSQGGGYVQSGNPIAGLAGFRVPTTANNKMGTAVLVGGTVTVSNISITANSIIFVTGQVPGGVPGALNISALVPSTSFTITSTSVGDTSTVGFLIMEPA